MTDRIYQETNGRVGHLIDDITEYRTEAENSLKEFRQDYSQFREQMNSEQATWQNKAGGEMEKLKDSVRLFEDRVTEVQAAAQSSVQKVNTGITYLREQLAARQLTDSAIPCQVLPVTAVDVENSSQSNSELATSAGNYHTSNCNADSCTTTVCGNATSQPNANKISGSAIYLSWVDHERKIRSRRQRTDIGKYSFVNRTIQHRNQLPAEVLGILPCNPITFKKRVRKVLIEWK